MTARRTSEPAVDGSSYGRSGEATALQSDPLNLGCSAGMEDRYSLSDRQIYVPKTTSRWI